MEPSTTYSYAPVLNPARAIGTAPALYPAPHIDPPISKQVLDRLAVSLAPPLSIARGQVEVKAQAKRRRATADMPGQDKLWAYKACASIISSHSKSFYFSARLLPSGKREGIMALYAFCRLSDDIVDNAATSGDRVIARAQARVALEQWARLNDKLDVTGTHPVMVAWADTRQRFGIPSELADDLLAGIRMDLTIDRYETWDDLWLYCYRVASTVGLMSMYITGADTMQAVPYAVQLGVALQLTNILRDVGEDARSGRIYLPEEDMHAFNYSAEMLRAGVINHDFVRLMRYEITRAHALYDAALAGIALLPEDSRLAVTAAASVYRAILGKIERSSYDVFNHRAHLGTCAKVVSLPSIWWKAKRLR